MDQLRLFVLLGLITIALPFDHIPQVVEAQSKQRPLGAQQIAARATPSVVVLFNVDGKRQIQALGSGFFVSIGLVATNFHVIKGATTIFGRVVGTEGVSKVVEVVVTDEEADLAILRFESLTGPSLQLARGLPQVGETVYAIGSPKGLEGTFTQGIVSAIRREDGLIQTQVPISPGSSGGPLLNSRGEVVGVAVGTDPGGQNLNFVIPVSRVRHMLAVATATAEPSSPKGGPALVPLEPPDNRWLSGDDSASKEAAKEREEATRRKAEDLIALGRDKFTSDDRVSALQAFQQARQLDPRNATAYFWIGLVHYLDDDNTKAQAAFTECVQIDPKRGVAWYYKGRIEYSEENYVSAEICAKRAIEHMPSLSGGHELLGDVYYRFRKYGEALESYRQAIRLDSQTLGPYCRMARIYKLMYSRADLASELLSQAYDSCVSFEGNYFFLGSEAADLGERTVALKCYERLKKMDSPKARILWERLY